MQLTIKNLTNLLLLLIALLACWFTVTAVNPQLHYFVQQPAFLTSPLFFESFARYPGGIADYKSEFITQFFYYKTFGSFLIILVASFQGILAVNILQRISGKVKLNFSVFTLFLLLSVLVQCNYYYPFYAGVRLLITVIFTWIFTVLAFKYVRWRHYISFCLAGLLFYLAGGAALIIFAISVILLQIQFHPKKSDLWMLPLFGLFSAALPYIAYKYLFLVNLPLVYLITHSKSPEILYYAPDYKLYALYSLLPLCILTAIISHKLQTRSKKINNTIKAEKAVAGKAGKNLSKKAENKTVIKTPSTKGAVRLSPLAWVTGQFIVMAVLSVFLTKHTFDKSSKNKILVSWYAANGEWDQVIKTAKNIEPYDIFVNFEYNRALANTGKLADNLFSFTQLAGPSGLFLDSKVTSDIPFLCCDQYYDLGFMHEAQHWAFEAQTIFPNSPRLLKRLVQTNLVNGTYELAEKFLRQLDKNMLYHDWVARYQKYLDDTTLVSKDKEFAWKRKCEPLENFTAPNAFLKLNKLLEANPQNKMALDYLLCGVLLDGDLGTFKNLITKNPIYTKTALPKVFDEALVLYHYTLRNEPAPGEIQYTKKRQEQFFSFVKSFQPFGNDWQTARTSLQREFGNTYWYYLKCLNPKVTQAQIKRE